MRTFLSVLALLLVAASSAPPRYLVAWAMEAQEHPAHGEGRDVLTVFDISDGSNFGKLVGPFRTATSLQRIKSKETPTNPVRSLNSTIAETW